MGIRSFVLRQFGHPRGLVAPLVARLLNRSNADQNHYAVRALEVEASHDVLDAGFGGGVGLRLLLDRVTEGRVMGLEVSEEMISRARDRFADAVAAGRLELRSGRLERLPLDDASLDRILSVNTYYFLDDPDQAFRQMRRVLRPHGRAVHAVVETKMLRRVGFNPEDHVLDEPEDIAQRARSAGFGSAVVEVPEEDDRIRLVVAEVAGGS